MSNITNILIEKGFKVYRKIYQGNSTFKYVECEYKGVFSSENGYLDYRFIKDNLEVIYGLNEKNKPPTLISPRPNDVYSDDEMNRKLLVNSLDVYNEIIKNNGI